MQGWPGLGGGEMGEGEVKRVEACPELKERLGVALLLFELMTSTVREVDEGGLNDGKAWCADGRGKSVGKSAGKSAGRVAEGAWL